MEAIRAEEWQTYKLLWSTITLATQTPVLKKNANVHFSTVHIKKNCIFHFFNADVVSNRGQCFRERFSKTFFAVVDHSSYGILLL
jgi:hypothetical protein